MQGLSYLITYRESSSDDRRENLRAVLSWLAQWPDIQVVVVEQDTVPRLDPLLHGCGVARFAYNPGPFNKAWGLNLAFGFAQESVLAIGDADVIAPYTFAAAAEHCRNMAAAKPYRTIVDLTPEETARVRAGEWGLLPARPAHALPDREGHGVEQRAGPKGSTNPLRSRSHVVFAGGLFLIQREWFLRVGGFDERFLGWGFEDVAMTYKLKRAGVRAAQVVGAPALHLWHPYLAETTFAHPHYADNRRLRDAYKAYSDAEFTRLCEVQRRTMGDLHKYRAGD